MEPALKRLRWALGASVAAHLIIVGSLPGVRTAASGAQRARPMRVVRAYQASVIPPQLLSAPAAVAAPRRAAKPVAKAPVPRPKRTEPAPPGAAEASARPPQEAAPRPAAVRVGPPEPLSLPAPAGSAAEPSGIFLSEPGPGRGEGASAAAAAPSEGGAGGTAAEAAGPAGGAPSDTGGGGGAGHSGSADLAAGEATVSPQALSLPRPAYPDEPRRRGEEGTVRLRVLVLTDGTVGRADVARSSGVAALDRAAREGARNWRFRPARRGETAVEAWVTLSIVFKLEDAAR